MTGFRLSIGGVQQETGIIPDLTAMGKSLGEDCPLAQLEGRLKSWIILPSWPGLSSWHLSGNPLAMAAGIASLKMLRNEPPSRSFQIMEINSRRDLEKLLQKKVFPYKFHKQDQCTAYSSAKILSPITSRQFHVIMKNSTIYSTR